MILKVKEKIVKKYNEFRNSQTLFMSDHFAFKGTLIPIGGNEDKGDKPTFKTKGILMHVLREAGGPDAKVVVIPTASSIPKEVGENYVDAFNKLGCTNVTVMNITDKRQSEDPAKLEIIRQANCVMFSGGNQARISSKIGGTSLHRLLRERLMNEDFVIAGTSAGAMAMAEEMIAGGSSTESLFKGAVKMKKGLGLMPGLIIDTHFVRRGRFGRLAEALAMHPSKVGIGLAEDTGIIIKHGTEFRVIGSGMVIMMDAGKLTHNKHMLLKTGTPMSISNLVTHILANGDHYSFSERAVQVLPIGEAFS
ncbi:MAG: hypothetical protein RL226_1102 [Bacteroidota bacterium]|jgi:cyanophycinase